jgi:hypothetical protein
MKEMVSYISHIISDRQTSLSEKIDAAIGRYIDGLSKNPNLPLFVFSELQANPRKLFDKVGIPKNLIGGSYMFEQIQEQIEKKRLGFSPIHFFINLVSLCVFPILGKPFLINVHLMNEKEYDTFINERKKLISLWLKSMLQLDENFTYEN